MRPYCSSRKVPLYVAGSLSLTVFPNKARCFMHSTFFEETKHEQTVLGPRANLGVRTAAFNDGKVPEDAEDVGFH